MFLFSDATIFRFASVPVFKHFFDPDFKCFFFRRYSFQITPVSDVPDLFSSAPVSLFLLSER